MSILKKLIPSLVLVGLIFWAGYQVYRYGLDQGRQEIQLQWELDKQATREAHDRLVEDFAQREALHRLEHSRIAHELAQAQKQHDVDLTALRAGYEQRLLHSENRAQVYQRQAEAGAAECRALAGHAARLDRSLVEGRELVREFADTLRLRERQLILLGEQMTSDRSVLEGEIDGE